MSIVEDELLTKWATIFHVIGQPIRLAIMTVLHGSEYTDQDKDECMTSKKCLRLSEIRQVLRLPPEADEKLIYHLNKLIEADLVKKIPVKADNGEWIFDPHYKVTTNWIKFSEDVDLKKIISNYFRSR